MNEDTYGLNVPPISSFVNIYWHCKILRYSTHSPTHTHTHTHARTLPETRVFKLITKARSCCTDEAETKKRNTKKNRINSPGFPTPTNNIGNRFSTNAKFIQTNPKSNNPVSHIFVCTNAFGIHGDLFWYGTYCFDSLLSRKFVSTNDTLLLTENRLSEIVLGIEPDIALPYKTSDYHIRNYSSKTLARQFVSIKTNYARLQS